MIDEHTSDGGDLDAGDFLAWVTGMQAALRSEQSSPTCNSCAACCRSSQFIHIAPDETDTLAHIPAELLFPRRSARPATSSSATTNAGIARCWSTTSARSTSIAHRPVAPTTVRVFPAAAVEIEDAAKAHLAQQTRRWRFSYPAPDDRRRHDAVRGRGVSPANRKTSSPPTSSPRTTPSSPSSPSRSTDAFVQRDDEPELVSRRVGPLRHVQPVTARGRGALVVGLFLLVAAILAATATVRAGQHDCGGTRSPPTRRMGGSPAPGSQAARRRSVRRQDHRPSSARRRRGSGSALRCSPGRGRR